MGDDDDTHTPVLDRLHTYPEAEPSPAPQDPEVGLTTTEDGQW